MKYEGLAGVAGLIVLTSFAGLAVDEGLTAAWSDLGRFLLWTALLAALGAAARIIYLWARNYRGA